MFANYEQGNIWLNEHFPVIAFSLITPSQNEQRKISVALSQDGGGGLGKSAGRYYGLRESCVSPGWPGEPLAGSQGRAAKEAAQSRPSAERERDYNSQY